MVFFKIFELVVIATLLYFIANLVRYVFFKGSPKGGFWALSDSWLKSDEKEGSKNAQDKTKEKTID